jgi:hypothetical protein
MSEELTKEVKDLIYFAHLGSDYSHDKLAHEIINYLKEKKVIVEHE